MLAASRSRQPHKDVPSFDGRVHEYPGLIIDCFDAPCRRTGQVFLLSHFHQDHTVGLSSPESRGCRIYATETTKQLAYALYGHLRGRICAVEYNKPFDLELEDEDEDVLRITVTAIDANHIIGSCMFLIEGPNGNVLYTGDCRLEYEFFQKLKASPVLKGKRIETLYLDTTYYHSRCYWFPSKKQSQQSVADFISQQPPEKSIYLECNMLGYEELFEHLCPTHGPIHVNKDTLSRYKDLSSSHKFLQHISSSASNSRLHSCCTSSSSLSTRKHEVTCEGVTKDFIYINPSSHWFTLNQSYVFRYVGTSITPVTDRDLSVVRIFYANHSSHSELKAFVDWLRPFTIVPITEIDDVDDYLLHFGECGGNSNFALQKGVKRPSEGNDTLNESNSSRIGQKMTRVDKVAAVPLTRASNVVYSVKKTATVSVDAKIDQEARENQSSQVTTITESKLENSDEWGDIDSSARALWELFKRNGDIR